MRFAAIDIGSNAVRLLLSQVIEGRSAPLFKKEALVRMPIRLGEDAFQSKRISDEKVERLVETMVGFRHLITAYPARDFMAVATSAMREAENGADVVRSVRERAGIELEIIDGAREAAVIYANHIEDRIDPNTNYLYVDVGGGSTELTLISQRAVVASASFKVGTVRMLQNAVDPRQWGLLKEWIKVNGSDLRPIVGIGSGGNVNKMYKLARIKDGMPIAYKRLRELYRSLLSFPLEERISVLGLRPDRADVIIPAAEIYLTVMKWARVKRMFVPQVGLSDGIIHVLYERHRDSRPAAPAE
jgi:exopolyphosphatase/guanosine-5'-triphosphate,3'-diphosphate pyrophosphatase